MKTFDWLFLIEYFTADLSQKYGLFQCLCHVTMALVTYRVIPFRGKSKGQQSHVTLTLNRAGKGHTFFSETFLLQTARFWNHLYVYRFCWSLKSITIVVYGNYCVAPLREWLRILLPYKANVPFLITGLIWHLYTPYLVLKSN